jgi:hypothetical protein
MFRILAIDGGGVRGYLAASILANIEMYLDRITAKPMSIGRRFDLIAGTSVGGLIALGLALGRTAKELRNLFESFVPAVFADTNKTRFHVRGLYPRYSNGPLRKHLEAFFDNKTMADLVVDACVTSVSLIDAKPRLHKTDYFSRNKERLNESLVDVALATTAAPTYFPAHSTLYSANLVDGGLAANNPALVALVDALQFERPSHRGTEKPALGENRPVLMSIGTGQPGPLPYNPERLANGGWLHWAKPIIEVLFLSQAQMIHHQVSFLLGDKYLRIDPILNVPVLLDDGKRYADLRNKADIDRSTETFLKTYLTEG